MFTLPDHFAKLLSNIEPDPTRAEAAAALPWQVRDYLRETDKIATVYPHSRLAGSYARYVATKGIKDVDIILLVAEAYRKQEPEVVLNDLFLALGGLAEALGDTGEVVIRRRQRRSIQVCLIQHEFDLDIVPAVASNGLDEALEIPDKDWSKWVKTHPLGYAARLSELNAQHSDKVVPLIKLVKHWRDVHMVYGRPKSYWLECMVYHQISSGGIATASQSYGQMFRDLLAAIYEDYASYLEENKGVPEVKDPMLNNDVVHNSWERPAFETFMRKIDESCGWMDKALGAETTEEAVEQWQNVFGAEWYPDNAAVARERGKGLREAAFAGALFVTSSGRVSATRPVHEAYVQPPVQRFFGDS